MAILKPDKTKTLGGVTVNEFLLTKHNPRNIAMPSVKMEGKIIGVTIHNTSWISVAKETTPAEQYTRATYNGNIPQKINPLTHQPHDTLVKRKVAAYARVSTDLEEQQTSYEAQVRYYTEYIKKNPEWEFVKVSLMRAFQLQALNIVRVSTA